MPDDSVSNDLNASREALHRQMMSEVAHDLKSPLAAIIGSLEICVNMPDRLSKAQQEGLLESALLEARRLDGFITNMLEMAKLENGMVSCKLESCDLHVIVQDALSRLGSRSEHGDIQLYPASQISPASADPALLGRALYVVLENALKHAGPEPVIQIEYGCDGERAYLRVRDNGPGVPEGKEQDIFSKYTSFPKSGAKSSGGAGLGLAICKSIMEMSSGSVQAENQAGGGCEFTLRFPAAA